MAYTCLVFGPAPAPETLKSQMTRSSGIVAIFYPFSQFCEITISLLSLQTQPNTAPNLFQRGVEYGKYVMGLFEILVGDLSRGLLVGILGGIILPRKF